MTSNVQVMLPTLDCPTEALELICQKGRSGSAKPSFEPRGGHVPTLAASAVRAHQSLRVPRVPAGHPLAAPRDTYPRHSGSSKCFSASTHWCIMLRTSCKTKFDSKRHSNASWLVAERRRIHSALATLCDRQKGKRCLRLHLSRRHDAIASLAVLV